jgi:4a-hydroxytetrahydrobiopterin dehydratase
MDVLDEAATAEALRQLPGWEQTGDAVVRTFVHDSFRLAVLFVERIADSTEGAAELAGHHPRIEVQEGKVTVALPTRKGGGLSRADVELAHRIQGLVGAHEHPPGMAGTS